ncbi:cell division protein Fic [Novosphingobium indicum]|uniref:Cell division protein Fic n=1 Tax=Novosphingobium indicum TaxID=462949 RepID=A0ABQ2JZE8_9SPHN|nr:Fic family protein [Novosphingobium indicum]GGN59177.1 cell division protein Fic [Novosphingobium indicum]
MKWNWQQPDWPKFRWESVPLAALEGQFLQQSGILIGSVKHLTEDYRSAITVDIMTGEALRTSEIEGELLNRDSVQSSLRREFGLETSDRRIPPAERGIAEMMIALYREFADPLTNETLFAWHEMVVSGRRDIDAVGRFRDHEDAMQVVSGLVHKPTVHFEAPPSKDVPEEMKGFLDWFTSSSPGGPNALPALTRAGIAHLYFVSIHPFEDGNGRIARALAEKALSQAIGQPSLIALSQVIQRSRSAYYDALEAANKRNEITDWLTYFAQTVLDAQEHSLALIDFLLAKVKFYDRFRDQMNERQARVIARMFREGIDGFTGGLSAANYITITGTSRATATRDLHELVGMGALTQTGMLKSTRYQLAIA